MAIARKIGYHAIKLHSGNDFSEPMDPRFLKEVLEYIQSLIKTDRRYFDENRFYFLDESEEFAEDKDIQFLLFKHAESGKIPPVIDEKTLNERKNPRGIGEGERAINHVALDYQKDEIIVLLEECKPGLTIGRFVYYMEMFAKNYLETTKKSRSFRIYHEALVKENFIEELWKLNRVSIGQIHTTKQLLGSEFLNLRSDCIRTIKEDIIVQVNAERSESIKEAMEEAFYKLVTCDEKITRVRVSGFDNEGHLVRLDTDIIKRSEFLDFETNTITGELSSQEMKLKLSKLLLELRSC